IRVAAQPPARARPHGHRGWSGAPPRRLTRKAAHRPIGRADDRGRGGRQARLLHQAATEEQGEDTEARPIPRHDYPDDAASSRHRGGDCVSRWKHRRIGPAPRDRARQSPRRADRGQNVHHSGQHRGHEKEMRNTDKGPRIKLRKPRRPGESYRWVILDRDACGRRVERKTGASAPSRGGAQELRSDAEKAFADYLGRKHKPEFDSGDPAQVRIADVLSFYGSEHAPTVVRADTLADAIENLGEFWNDDMVS